MTTPHSRTDWITVWLLFAAGLFAAAQFGKICLNPRKKWPAEKSAGFFFEPI